MQPFTSKQLYIMNGGNKLYIYKDGFGDVYEATPEEEAAWAEEVVAGALAKIDTEENSVSLSNAVENLAFHKYKGLRSLLMVKMGEANPNRKLALAAALATLNNHEKDAELVDASTTAYSDEYTAEAFDAVRDRRDDAAKRFIFHCLEGDDHELAVKATTVLEIWAYSGMPALRQDNLLGKLQPENKGSEKFRTALEQLRTAFQLTNNA